jgi:hypothetical protein
MARALTPDAPWAAYQGKPQRMQWQGIQWTHTHITLHPECGRALYRRFKQGYRRLARKEAAAIQLLQKLGASRR